MKLPPEMQRLVVWSSCVCRRLCVGVNAAGLLHHVTGRAEECAIKELLYLINMLVGNCLLAMRVIHN